MRIVAMFALTLLAAPAVAAEDCQLKAIASLPMSFDAVGGVGVPVSIAGQQIKLLVDTGGVGSMLTQTGARTLGLEPQRVFNGKFTLYGGREIDHFVTASDFVIGKMRSEKYEFLILPDDALSDEFGGTLAPDILLAFDDDFDFANARLNLISPNHCTGQVVYWTKGAYADIPFRLDDTGHVELTLRLDGKDVLAQMDTGTTQSTMSLELAQSLFGIDEKSPDVKALPVDGAIRTFTFPFKTLSFGGVTVINPRISLVPNSQGQVWGAAKFLLGMNVLRQLHLYISYKEKKLYVTAASAH